GHFDDVDLAMMIHTSARREDGKAAVPASNNGRVAKTARFIGRASHAGGAPWNGINALYAAQIALAAINAQRETFRDDDTIRVHPILTHGGSQVNVIPGETRIEIETLPGYLPLACDPVMTGYFKDNARALFGADQYRDAGHRGGSTDMGDLSQIMP